MKPSNNHQASKHRPRGFESLEPRYALDATGTATPSLLPPPLLGITVYAAPIGPVPVAAKPAIASATSPTTTTPTSILPPISLAYIQRLNGAALPIGPARLATLPSQQQALPTIPPATPASPLYAEGVLPTNQTPANLPTTQQSLPVVTDPPGVPTFTLFPSRPLY